MVNPLELRLAALSQRPVSIDAGRLILEPMSTACLRMLQSGKLDLKDDLIGYMCSDAHTRNPLVTDYAALEQYLDLFTEWGELQSRYLLSFKTTQGFLPVDPVNDSWHEPVFKYLVIRDDRYKYEEDIKYTYEEHKNARETNNNK